MPQPHSNKTLRYQAGSRQDRAAPGGRRRLPVIGGIDIRLAHWLPGELAEGHASHYPFDQPSGGDVLI